ARQPRPESCERRAGARLAGEGRPADGHGALAVAQGGSAGHTTRVVGRLRKPHGQHGEVAILPLVENPGLVFAPKVRLYIVDEERRVVAGPLVVARRRAYHREWLIGFEGVEACGGVGRWRNPLLSVWVGEADD